MKILFVLLVLAAVAGWFVYQALVEGALAHPLLVGCHWFQYRDQPLVGRSDGEAYQCGFVNGTDRPYEELCAAARAVGETMYPLRASSR